ncbi:E3 ubiquitin-protein ligase TTC3-like isoform X2 [Stegodyphus dumicola]|uniref:E3 ubiquitin-protein ligase TTC3-like isoform X2 n=1 Tax=Stegodyphus dumicola TaxID=202533 RepID=UPI0015A800A1|nr:E3 ubiquitin-protein ligase TTC3-like isoform X2 [Stegodyphus dumicola]
MDDTKSEHLKVVVGALIEECENPPPPVAVCLYDACQFNQPIYYSDPGFKGFFSVFCSEHCSLHYHPQCWKELKNSKGLSEKEFLAQPCFTPDCEGVIFKVTSTTKEGIIGKTFQLPESKKETKQKKSKLERKLEERDNRKRKRRDSKCDSISDVTSEVASDNASPVPPMKKEGSKCTNEIKQNETTVASNPEPKLFSEAETPSTSKLSVDAQPFYILKKPAIDENSHRTPSKVKEPKKFKSSTLSIDDFYENVSYNFEKRTSFPQKCSQLFFPSRWSDGNINEGNEINTSDLLGSHGGPTELESIKSNVYSYLEELLTLRGPLRIDDPILVDELKNFPTEANIMIADCGGIGEFLKNNIRFAYVGNTYVCVAADVVAAYNKCRNSLSFNDETFYSSNIIETFEEDENKSVTSGSSYLNPDAKEYSPVSSKLSDLPPTENVQRSQSYTVNSGVDNSRRNSESLLSVVSKLRKRIVVDDKLTSFGSTSSINNDELLQIRKLSNSVQSIPSNFISSAESNSAENSSVENKLDINIPQFIKMLQNYSSDEMRKHHLDIESAIKPYSIVILPKTCNRIIQTEDCEAEKLSRGVQKSDEEFERIKEVAMILADDKHMLREQNAQLQKQLDVALDSATKSQKKSSVEIINLKATLEEVFSELEAEKKTNKNKELKWEKELKHLQDSLNKANEKIDEQKKENETLNMNLERTSSELQRKLYMETIENLEQKIHEMTERAKTAEHQVLKLKKSEFLKRIDQKISEAGERMKELQGGIPLISPALNPIIVKNMETLLTQIRSYINKLGEIRHVFMRSIDHQIQRVTSGIPLKDLPPLEVAELPEIPKWSQANAQTMNFLPQQIPSIVVPPANSEIKIPSLPLAAAATTETSAPYLNSKTSVSSFQPAVQSGLLNPLLQSSVQPGTLNPSLQSAVQSGTLFKDMITKPAPTSSLKKLSSDVQEKEKTVLSLNNPKIPQPSSSATKVDNFSSNVSEVEVKGASNRMTSPDLELGYKVAENGIEKPTPVYNTADIQKKPAVSESKNSYEKLLSKLQIKYPNYSQAHLVSFVKDYRSQRKGKLSGLTLETIINEVSEFIESQGKAECSVSEAAKKSRLLQNRVLVNKKIACDEPVVVENAPAPKKAAWNVRNDSNKNWSGSSIEDCVICCEEMNFSTAYKADCGHRFHLTCIREWLNKKSDCPICRVYLLLPEDYPALS